jgi:hypothetical protein
MIEYRQSTAVSPPTTVIDAGLALSQTRTSLAQTCVSPVRQEQTFGRLRVITSVQIGGRKLRLQNILHHYLIRIPRLGVRSMPGINLRLFGWLKR